MIEEGSSEYFKEIQGLMAPYVERQIMVQQVPLKNGIGGPVIGTATIQDDGSIVAQITDPDFSGLITADLSNISIPEQKTDNHAYVCRSCQVDRCELVKTDISYCVCCSNGHVI